MRERVREYARQRRTTQAAILAHALDLFDREAFFEQLRRDVEGLPENSTDVAAREAWLRGPVITEAE